MRQISGVAVATAAVVLRQEYRHVIALREESVRAGLGTEMLDPWEDALRSALSELGYCATMGRPKVTCGCPDCGRCLVDVGGLD